MDARLAFPTICDRIFCVRDVGKCGGTMRRVKYRGRSHTEVGKRIPQEVRDD